MNEINIAYSDCGVIWQIIFGQNVSSSPILTSFLLLLVFQFPVCHQQPGGNQTLGMDSRQVIKKSQ